MSEHRDSEHTGVTVTLHAMWLTGEGEGIRNVCHSSILVNESVMCKITVHPISPKQPCCLVCYTFELDMK